MIHGMPLASVKYLPFALAIIGNCGAPKLVTAKGIPLLATPPTVTTTLPVVAPIGTGAVMLVALQFVGVAVVPLIVTVLVPCVEPKLIPMIVTEVPTGPEPGFQFVILGRVEVTVNVAALLVTVPALLLTTTINVEPLSLVVVAGVV
jgi:hypothetical protein